MHECREPGGPVNWYRPFLSRSEFRNTGWGEHRKATGVCSCFRRWFFFCLLMSNKASPYWVIYVAHLQQVLGAAVLLHLYRLPAPLQGCSVCLGEVCIRGHLQVSALKDDLAEVILAFPEKKKKKKVISYSWTTACANLLTKCYLRQVTTSAMTRMRSSAPPAGDTTTAISL